MCALKACTHQLTYAKQIFEVLCVLQKIGFPESVQKIGSVGVNPSVKKYGRKWVAVDVSAKKNGLLIMSALKNDRKKALLVVEN